MTLPSELGREESAELPQIQPRWPRALLTCVVVVVALLILAALILPVVQRPRELGPRYSCKNNLKQIALALHNYHDTYGSLPPAYTVDALGNRLHSWRTLILPYLDQKPLYDKIDLSKAWDDAANAAFRSAAVAVYQCPSADLESTRTTYLAFVGDDFCLAPTRGRAFKEITDGLSNTVMIFETDKSHAVHWMSPDDGGPELFLKFNEKTPQVHKGGTYIALADGSVRFFGTDRSQETRKALMTIAGGEVVGEF